MYAQSAGRHVDRSRVKWLFFFDGPAAYARLYMWPRILVT